MSASLTQISKKVRKYKQTATALTKLEKQLENGEFQAGRGARKLSGTKNIFYMRSGNKGRLFFRYSEKRGEIEKNESIDDIENYDLIDFNINNL